MPVHHTAIEISSGGISQASDCTSCPGSDQNVVLSNAGSSQIQPSQVAVHATNVAICASVAEIFHRPMNRLVQNETRKITAIAPGHGAGCPFDSPNVSPR